MKKLRLHFIICKVIEKEARCCIGKSRHNIDITILNQQLHNNPENITEQIQDKLRLTRCSEGNLYDAVLLGYGLCSNAIAGLKSEIPMIVPRSHDCITLLLGSREKYLDYFRRYKGIYWYSPGWIETNAMPSAEKYDKLLKDYTADYGRSNAEFLIETEQKWIKDYSRAVFIDWPEFDNEKHKEYTKKAAKFLNWQYDCIQGDSSYMQRLVDGCWDNDEFLTVPPGQSICAEPGLPEIITAQTENNR